MVLLLFCHLSFADISTLVDTKLPDLTQLNLNDVSQDFPVSDDIAATVDNKFPDLSQLDLNDVLDEVTEAAHYTNPEPQDLDETPPASTSINHKLDLDYVLDKDEVTEVAPISNNIFPVFSNDIDTHDTNREPKDLVETTPASTSINHNPMNLFYLSPILPTSGFQLPLLYSATTRATFHVWETSGQAFVPYSSYIQVPASTTLLHHHHSYLPWMGDIRPSHQPKTPKQPVASVVILRNE